MTAVLERDDEGRVVRATARRLTGARAGESVLLDAADLGVELDEPTATPIQRIAARADEAPAEVAPVAAAFDAPDSILALPPTAWAEERI